MKLADINAYFEREHDRIVEEWCELLRFPSVSTDPAHHQDCLDCADWLRDHLQGIGLEARLLDTATKPVVYAEHRGGEPTVLFYGHYDVQPADPLDAWKTPPFTPTQEGDRVRARGADDNKGQHFYALKAIEALVRNNDLNCTLKVILEGEEESGSSGMTTSLPEWQDLLQADVLVVTDISMAAIDRPSITMGLRGVVHLTVEVHGPIHDLHSGVHGGVAPNPATALASLLAGLHDAEGRIAIPGFYDSVLPPSAREQEMAVNVPFDETAYREAVGVPPVGGERGFTPIERLGFRPSLDINGIQSGFNGPGMKTIIPDCARAKLTARLAAGQDPEAALDAIVAHLEAGAPPGLTLSITDRGVGGAGFRLDPDSAIVAKATDVLKTMMDNDPVLRWEGASIPIIAELARVSGAEPLLIGFGLEEDSIHAPNESFSLQQFKLGFQYMALLLSALG